MAVYKQITPVSDWFFVNKIPTGDGKQAITVFYLAAWGVIERYVTAERSEDKIVGLISPGPLAVDECGQAMLTIVPPTGGSYKHRNELNGPERRALENNGYLELELDSVTD